MERGHLLPSSRSCILVLVLIIHLFAGSSQIKSIIVADKKYYLCPCPPHLLCTDLAVHLPCLRGYPRAYCFRWGGMYTRLSALARTATSGPHFPIAVALTHLVVIKKTSTRESGGESGRKVVAASLQKESYGSARLYHRESLV